MPIFRYEALDPQGKLVRGAMDGANEQAVRNQLAVRGYRPQSVMLPGVQERQPPPQAVPAAAAPAQAPLITSTLSIADQALFWRQVAELARAGITPFDMFQTLGARTRNRRIRAAALDVAARVQAGSSVADAMAANAGVFGNDCRLAVLAGEHGGFAHEVYADLAASLEEEKQHQERWRWLRWYHNAMIVLALVFGHLFLYMGHYISDSGMLKTDPEAGEWMAFLSQGMRQWMILLIGRVLPAGIVLLLMFRFALGFFERGRGRPVADRVSMLIPGVAMAHRHRLVERFVRLLRRLVQGGVSPVVAWDAAAEATANHAVASKLRAGRNSLMSGGGYAGAFHAAGLFTYNDIQMMTTADRTGRVPEMLQQIETDYAGRAGTSSRVIRLIGIFVGGVIAAVIVAWTFYTGVSQYVGMYLKAFE